MSARKAIRIVVFVSGIMLALFVGIYLGVLLEQSVIKRDYGSVIYSQKDIENQMNDLQSIAGKEISEATTEGYNRGYEEGKVELLDYIRQTLLSGSSAIGMLRPLFPNQVLVISNGTYHFVDIKDTLPKNNINKDMINVDEESGEMTLTDNGNVVSHKGIDVSSFQGNINWSKVAADGVEFAFVRAIYRGYGTGKLVEDKSFDDNMKGAIDHDIHVGAYVFTQAINDEEMLEEANLAISKVAKYGNGIPIALDIERVAGKEPRMDALSVEERTRLVRLFCDTVSKAGHKPMLYYNTEMGILYLDLEELYDIDIWYALYADSMIYPYDIAVWQYSDKGSVDGIKNNVDMNIALKEFWR